MIINKICMTNSYNSMSVCVMIYYIINSRWQRRFAKWAIFDSRYSEWYFVSAYFFFLLEKRFPQASLKYRSHNAFQRTRYSIIILYCCSIFFCVYLLWNSIYKRCFFLRFPLQLALCLMCAPTLYLLCWTALLKFNT